VPSGKYSEYDYEDERMTIGNFLVLKTGELYKKLPNIQREVDICVHCLAFKKTTTLEKISPQFGRIFF
jgi:hypothetical protein